MTRKIAVGTLHYSGTFNQLEELLLGALFLLMNFRLMLFNRIINLSSTAIKICGYVGLCPLEQCCQGFTEVGD